RSTPSAESTATPSRIRRASAATRASLAGATISLLMKMSAMPCSASASASPTFCTQTPTAPASICSRAIAALLCIFACGRRPGWRRIQADARCGAVQAVHHAAMGHDRDRLPEVRRGQPRHGLDAARVELAQRLAAGRREVELAPAPALAVVGPALFDLGPGEA